MEIQTQNNIFEKKTVKKKRVLTYLQKIGKSLLFPIAILPFAAIFSRISDLIPVGTGSEFADIIASILSTIGNAIFGPILPIIFAIGVSFGMTKDQRGEAALVGFVSMIMLQLFLSPIGGGMINGGIGLVDKIYGSIHLSPDHNAKPGFEGLLVDVDGNPTVYQNVMVNNVFNGVMIGIFVSLIYNKFNGIELPSILGFFSGRRLIPVLALSSGLILGIIWTIIFPWIAYCIYYLSYYMAKGTSNRYVNAAIMGGYGFINRMLIPFGLHHIPNTVFWFTLGSMQDVNGNIVNGDINIFLNGVPYANGQWNNAGTFQSGFFPIMMFGLPTIAYLFYKTADNKVQAKRVASLLFGSAIVSFFTGITEPLEFSFMFISPILFLMHAILTGFWGLIVGLFGIQLGFGFSAGFIDFALSIPKSLEIINAKYYGISGVVDPIYNKAEWIFANPFMLFPIGVLTSISYYWIGKMLIVKFNAESPGRGNAQLNENEEEKNLDNTSNDKYLNDSMIIINSIGIDNIIDVQWCATRLRFELKDNSIINEKLIKKSCSRGEIKIGTNGYQVIIGNNVEMIGMKIQELLSNKNLLENSNNKSISTKNNEIKKVSNNKINVYAPINCKVIPLSEVPDKSFSDGMLGGGVAIIPKGNQFDSIIKSGEIELAFDTGHAYSFKTKDGTQILMHIGIDSINLKTKDGKDVKVFKPFVKTGSKINYKTKIVEVNNTKLKTFAKSNITPIIVIDETLCGRKINIKSLNKNVKKGDILFSIE